MSWSKDLRCTWVKRGSENSCRKEAKATFLNPPPTTEPFSQNIYWHLVHLMFQKRSLGQSSSCTTFWMFLFFFILAWYMKSGIHWLRARIFSPQPLKKEHGVQRAAGLVRKWTRGSVLEVAIFFESGGVHDAAWVRRSLNLSLAFAWCSSLEHISTPFFLLQISLSLAYRATHKSKWKLMAARG